MKLALIRMKELRRKKSPSPSLPQMIDEFDRLVAAGEDEAADEIDRKLTGRPCDKRAKQKTESEE